MAACWSLQMPMPAKAVLMSLADNANDQGECWPSIDTIAKRTCMHRASVIRAIATLEQLGHVVADRENGRHTRYIVTPRSDLFEGNKPVAHSNRSQAATGSAQQPVAESNRLQTATNQSQRATGPVAQCDSNRKEPSRTVKKNSSAAELDFSAWPSRPDQQLLTDWLECRKKKRAPVTPTVMKRMGKELHAAKAMGFSVADCLEKCVMRGWAGFEAEWMQNDQRRGGGRTPSGGGDHSDFDHRTAV
jgi:DNA-binding transcriptional regulator YhcF (GntR family)